MSKGLFSLLKRRVSSQKAMEEAPSEELRKREGLLLLRLSLLSPERRATFDERLRGIIEYKSKCVEYGAKDPIHLSYSDVLTIRENLYQKYFSSPQSS